MDAAVGLDYEILGNPVRDWAAGLVLAVAIIVLLVVARRALAGRLRKLAATAGSPFWKIAADIAASTTNWFIVLVALVAGVQFLSFTPFLMAIFSRVTAVGWLVQVGLWLSTGSTTYLSLRRRRRLKEAPGEAMTLDLLAFGLRAAIWTIVALTALDRVGINVSALVAGLGIGGIAVALAARSILADLLASLSIVFDRPFVVGDVLGIDDFTGSVEKVGLKTTRMRSQSGEQLVFSNTDLLASRIRNYGRMAERRVSFTVGVTYETRFSQLRSIPDIIRVAIEAEAPVRFERAHFQKYGDFALVFEAVYHVLSPRYALYMDIQQSINLKIFERFAEEGIRFAYPTQTLYVAGPGTEAQLSGRRGADGIEDIAAVGRARQP
jgi:small-conductance mechanosensitive channel